MKKSPKKLALSRETIQHLDSQRMDRLVGAGTDVSRCWSCDIPNTTCVNHDSDPNGTCTNLVC
jgi:hypothetical protein